MRRARTTAAVLLLGVALLAGCGSQDAATPTAGDDPSSSSRPTSTSAAPAPSASASTPESGVDTSSWQSNDRDKTMNGAGNAAVLKAIRTGGHDGYDRVVLELSRPIGGYHIGYVDKVTKDPSGKPLPLEGNAFLQVVIYNATTDNAFQIPPGKHRTYPGPDSVAPALDQVQQIAVAGDFEATLSFGIGLASKAGYQVQVLKSPTRLVIDIAQS